jgi:adenylate cyclase
MSSSDTRSGPDARHGGKLFDQMSRGEVDLAALVPAFRKMQAADAEAFIGELARSYGEQRALLDIAQSLGSHLDLLPLLEKILEKTTQLVQADRASVFLLDRDRSELWSKVAQGVETAEIRFPLGQGIAGQVASTGQAMNVADAYQSPHFNPDVDQKTGYRTKSMLCMPIRDDRGSIIGVVSVINSKRGAFTPADEATLSTVSTVFGVALRNSILYEEVRARQNEVATLLDVGNALSQTLDLSALIQIIMRKASEIMSADRSTLFLIDRRKGELWSKVAEGLEVAEIRVPLGQGIAGHVAATGETLNINNAYEHPLFNRDVDRRTGYRTQTILCMPLRNSSGEVIGVTQVVNKRAGAFSALDERLLGAFSAQAAVAIDNAQLFERVREMKTYLENILQSLSDAVITVDADGTITTVNAAARRLLAVEEAQAVGQKAGAFLARVESELPQQVERVEETGKAYLQYDFEARNLSGKPLSVNVNIVPLLGNAGEKLGTVVVLEDVTTEKRVKSSLSRFMSKAVADKLLAEEGTPVLGGVRQEVTILFSDIRSYTTLTEGADAHQIVELLNEYFTYMVDVIFSHEGILDKFIGDAIMAVFGSPFSRPDVDPFNAVSAALDMDAALKKYNELRAGQGKKTIDVGIGISSGEVVCGYIGSERRMEYTAIGDGVNLASRLEGATKQYAARVMVSEFTHAKVADRFHFRELDNLQVKGKTRGVRVYEVLGHAARPLSPETSRMLETYVPALELYKAARFKEALPAFEAGRAAWPKDKVFALYVDRCRHFIEQPPPADWNGVWEMKDK